MPNHGLVTNVTEKRRSCCNKSDKRRRWGLWP